MKAVVYLMLALCLTGMCLFVGAATAQEAEPSSPAPAVKDAAPSEPTLAEVKAELDRLREEVLKLQQTLDLYMTSIVADLRAENERLRREVRQLSAETGSTLPPVPMPDKELLQGLYEPKARAKTAASTQAAREESSEPKQLPPPDASEPGPSGELQQEIIAEWGRTPEEAASSDPKVASLKGMICAVPANTGDDRLIALGRALRKKFEEYDNINIEVFDDVDAARAFSEKHVGQPDHRVLSISKHAASGRDVIVLIRGDKALEVPLSE
jgi:hypothetical protein